MHAERVACTICIWPASKPNLHLSSILASHLSMKSILHCLCFWDPSILNKDFNWFRQRILKGISEKALIRKKSFDMYWRTITRCPVWRYQLQLTLKPSLKWYGKGNCCRITLTTNKDWTFSSDWVNNGYTRVRKMCCSMSCCRRLFFYIIVIKTRSMEALGSLKNKAYRHIWDLLWVHHSSG